MSRTVIIGYRLGSWRHRNPALCPVAIWTPRWRWSNISGCMYRERSRSQMPVAFMTMVMVMMAVMTMMLHWCLTRCIRTAPAM